jgi:hypothetical protein
MTCRRVLVPSAPGPAGEAVRSVATAVAPLLGGTVQDRKLRGSILADESEGERTDLIRAAQDEEVVGVVISGTPDHTVRAMHLAAAIDRPVVLSPGTLRAPYALNRVLLPLDGTREAADAVSATAQMVQKLGLDMVVLHCVHGAAVPRFQDHPQYDAHDRTREFIARYLEPVGDVHLELRVGTPGRHAVDVSQTVDADLIVLGWSRHPTPRRAQTVRSILAHSVIPVMLLSTRSPHPSGSARAGSPDLKGLHDER